jgi:glyoxalase family protein
MRLVTAGLHHVTAIAADPARCRDFYTRVLGLRLVKVTVNFDAPTTYHLYFADAAARPGTILTFFPFTDAARGRSGAGTARAVALAVARDALPDWAGRLAAAGVEVAGPWRRFGIDVLGCRDPDGLDLELAAVLPPGASTPELAGVTLALADPEPTARLLEELLGFAVLGEEAGRLRLTLPGDAPGRVIDLVAAAGSPELGAGSVHHIAFRARDTAEQQAWRELLLARGLGVSEVRDRRYFQSIYAREPGGVLLEIATDPPGFAVDEAPSELGSALMLPPWLEPRRAEIERRLPPLALRGRPS